MEYIERVQWGKHVRCFLMIVQGKFAILFHN